MIRFIKNLFSSIFSFIGGLFSTGKKKTDQLTLSVKESQLASSITEGPGQTLEKAKQLASPITEGPGQALEKAKQLASPITESSGQAFEKTKQLASAAVGSSGQAFEQALGGDKAQTAQGNGKATESRKLKQANTKQPTKVEAAKANGSQLGTTGDALNMPKPKVTRSSSNFSTSNFSTFGDRRYPGANMQSFLKMARQMKPAR
jgi:hypothetical protein